MNILIAPDKYKSSLTAMQVCEALEDGLKASGNVSIHKLPLADGGDGTAEILGHHFGAEKVSLQTLDPLGRNINSSYYLIDDKAFIELADSSGIALLKTSELAAEKANTFGTGQQILDAINKGVKDIFLCLGGSASNDCGLGILSALGIKFLDQDGKTLEPSGESLSQISRIEETDSAIPQDLQFTILVDVDNPLYGPNGAAAVYAPQKGADESMVNLLDQGLRDFSNLILDLYEKDIAHFKGAGAAGGVAAGLKAFSRVEIKPGFETIAKLTHLSNAIEQADLVITGEGKIDDQSLYGKVVGGVYDLCKRTEKEIILVCGISQIPDSSILTTLTLYSIIELAGHREEAIQNASHYLNVIGKEIASNWSS